MFNKLKLPIFIAFTAFTLVPLWNVFKLPKEEDMGATFMIVLVCWILYILFTNKKIKQAKEKQNKNTTKYLE